MHLVHQPSSRTASVVTRWCLVGLMTVVAAGVGGCSDDGVSGEPGPPEKPGPGDGIPSFPRDVVLPTEAPVLIPGSGSVGDTGQPGYSIPLWIPDGPNGMSPRLSLQYGGSSNGRLGVGWHIGGLSTIAPCTKTVASDGEADGVDFDRTDAYCLDGEKLVEDTTVDFSFVSRHFKTEAEKFMRIRADYVDAGAPQPMHFIVETRDGRILTYEAFMATRIKGEDAELDAAPDGGVAPVYPIVSAVDRTGENRIHYTYDHFPDSDPSLYEFSYRIAQIAWSFDSNGPAHRRLEFVYETTQRPDPIISFMSGVRFANRHRLTAIEAYAPNPHVAQRVWSYHLGYEVSPQSLRSRLNNVRLCDRNYVCSWDKEISWTNGGLYVKEEHTVSDNAEFSFIALSRNPLAYADYQNEAGANFYPPTDVRLMVFDADGDGIDDVLYRTKVTRYTPQDNYNNHYQINLPVPTFDYEPGHIYLRRSEDGAPLSQRTEMTSLFEPPWWQAHLGKSRVTDLNADGIPDLLLSRTKVYGAGGGNVFDTWSGPYGGDPFFGHWEFGYTWLTGYPWDSQKSSVLDEVVVDGPIFRGAGNLYSYHLFKPPFQRALTDLDSDGRVDHIDAFPMLGDPPFELVDDLETNWFDFKSKHKPKHYQYALAGGDRGVFSHRWTCNNGNIAVGDFNGDGRGEAFASTDDEVDGSSSNPGVGLYKRLHLDDFDPVQDYSPAAVGDTSNLRAGDCSEYVPDLVFGDFNGDGLQDALYLPQSWNGNTQPVIRWNFGTSFGPVEPFPVNGPPGMADLLHQAVPVGKDGLPVSWDRGTRTADLNEDGRTDIVAFRLDAVNCFDPNANFGCNKLKTIVALYLSAGDHFESYILHTWQNGGVSLAEGFSTAQVGDVTGDGYTDIVHVLGDGKIRVLELDILGGATDRVAFVRDMTSPEPSHTFEYTRAWWGTGSRPSAPVCPWPSACPRRGFTVVQKEQVFAGTDAAGDPMRRTRTHRYENPRTDLQGRGFVGFEKHFVWDRELGQQSIVEYDLTRVDLDPAKAGGVFYPYAGSPKSIRTITPLARQPSETEIDGSSMAPGLEGALSVAVRISLLSHEYELRSSLNGRVITVLPSSNDSAEWETAGPISSNALIPSYVLPNSAPPILRELQGSFTYDAYGNLTNETHETTGGTTTSGTATYENRSGSQWLLGLQTSTTITGSHTPAPANAIPASPPKHVVRATYDAVGNLEVVTVSSLASSSPCGSPDPTACEDIATTTTFVYDARGNVTSFTAVGADEQQPRSASFDWDAEGIYQQRVTDALGYTHVTLTHPALGISILDQDHLGVTTLMKVDGFGRLREASRPGMQNLTRSYAPYIDGNRRGITAHDARSGGGSAYTDYDELGRPIYRGTTAYDGSTILVATEYNSLGAATLVRRPHVNSVSPYVATHTYDRLGRVLRVVAPDDALTTYEHTMFSTTTLDPENHETYVLRDVNGRVIESGHRIDGIPYGELTVGFGAFDQVETVTDAEGNVTTIEHDAFGRRLELDDPDTGLTVYAFNGFGELTTEIAGNGDTTTYEYDVLGRARQSTGPDGTTLYTWDVGPNAALKTSSVTGPDNVLTEYVYDSLGRRRQVALTIAGATYTIDQSYDQYGRLYQIFYPQALGHSRFAIQYRYNQNGYLGSIDDITACNTFPSEPGQIAPNLCPPVAPEPIWTVDSRDRNGAAVQATFGNGKSVVRIRDAATGRLGSLLVGVGYLTNYTYWDDGNLKSRVHNYAQADLFSYDPLHRLTQWTTYEDYDPERPPEEADGTWDYKYKYKYDELGNLEEVRSGGATIFHGVFGAGTRPHAIQSSNAPTSFGYDDRGRQISGGGRTIAWSQYDLPRTIHSAGVTTQYQYDATGVRAHNQLTVGGVQVYETTYLGSLYQRRVHGGGEAHVYLVHSETGPVAQVEYSDIGETKRYLVTDPLGSVVLVLDDVGAVLEESRYDPFGARIDTGGNFVVDPDPTTTVGFTGHEQEADGLINMRGRIYDRRQYRFLTPDPIIQAPLFGQSHNPYSYVLNNPLRYADPSGFQALPEDGGPPQRQMAEPAYANETIPRVFINACPDWGCGDKPPPIATKGSDRTGGSPSPRPSGSSPPPPPTGGADAARLAATVSRELTRIRSMQEVTDALADLNSWYFSRSTSLTHGGAEHLTLALLETSDASGYRYIIGVNGRGLSKAMKADLISVIPDLIIAENLPKYNFHAEVVASNAADAAGLKGLRGAVSKYSCDNCAAHWVDKGIENLTGAAADHGGKVTRPRIPNAISAAQDVGKLSRVRSFARVATPILEGIAAPLGALTLGMNLSQGRQADALLGDVTGLAGSVLSLTGGNPMAAGALGAFSTGYGLSMAGLEWAFGEVPPLSWDDIF